MVDLQDDLQYMFSVHVDGDPYQSALEAKLVAVACAVASARNGGASGKKGTAGMVVERNTTKRGCRGSASFAALPCAGRERAPPR